MTPSNSIHPNRQSTTNRPLLTLPASQAAAAPSSARRRPPAGPHLLVCSGGGHLKQLHTLADRIGIPVEDQFWVTFDTGLSRSLLKGREVVFATYAAPRDAKNIFRNTQTARRILSEWDFASVISTGASLAVSYLPLAARRGIPAHYIESAARAQGPSLTGKILALDPLVHTYTQYPVWSSQRWAYRGSIFDAYAPASERPAAPVRRVVVTVGTTESYGFERLFRAAAPLLAGTDVVWQTGTSDVAELGIEARPSLPADELDDAIRQADVVIAHSGTGAALTALEHGKSPILVPRLARFGEHIDDHQLEIAAELERRGLALAADPADLSEELLGRAAARTVTRLADPPPFELTAPVPVGRAA